MGSLKKIFPPIIIKKSCLKAGDIFFQGISLQGWQSRKCLLSGIFSHGGQIRERYFRLPYFPRWTQESFMPSQILIYNTLMGFS